MTSEIVTRTHLDYLLSLAFSDAKLSSGCVDYLVYQVWKVFSSTSDDGMNLDMLSVRSFQSSIYHHIKTVFRKDTISCRRVQILNNVKKKFTSGSTLSVFHGNSVLLNNSVNIKIALKWPMINWAMSSTERDVELVFLGFCVPGNIC